MPRVISIFAVLAMVFSPLTGVAPAHAGPAATNNSYFDGFLDLTGIDPFKSADVELDALGGVRIKGNGVSQPAAWTAQADFQGSIFYKPTLFIDDPLIPLATLDAATVPGSLVLPTSPYAFRRAQTEPVLLPADPASGDGYSVGGMCVRRVDLDATYYMWYTGVPENEFTARIYLAKSDDGVAWVRANIDPDTSLQVPVLDVGPPGSFDSRQLGKPSVVYDPDAPVGTPKFKMWYTAEGDLTGSIGYATSDDGVTWTKWEQPIVALDGPDDVGQYASLAVGEDGLPIVAYYDVTNADLKFARCGNAFCNEGNTILTLDQEGDVGRYASLAVAGDGFPVIAYYDATNGDLKVIHCGTAGCTVGNVVSTIDGALADVGQYSSVKVDAEGFPAVAYYDVTNGDLKFVKCTDYACSGGDEVPALVDGAAGDVGKFASLGFAASDPLNPASRAPAIVYYDATNFDLKLVVCNDALCAGGDETPAVLDAASDVGQYASMAVNSLGYPAIAYYDATATALKFLACNDGRCAGGDDTPIVLDDDPTTDTGRFSRVVFGPAGLPVVACYDATNADLLAISCNDAACGGGDETPFLVDEEGDVGQHLSLAAFTEGDPRLAYYDATNGDLKIASSQRQPTAVLTAGIIGSVDSYSVAHPSVMFDGGVYRMWYTANDSNNRRIAYASSGDGVTWARGGLVIDVDNTANDRLGAWSPSVTKAASGYAMVYTGWKAVAGGNTVQAKLITADSGDGTTWVTGNVALNDPVLSMSQPAIIYDPADTGALYKMWYVANAVDPVTGTSHDRVYLAIKALSGSWGKVAGTAGLDSVMGLGIQSTAFDSMYAYDLRVLVPNPSEPSNLVGLFTGTNGNDFKERIGVKSSADGGLSWEDQSAPDPLIGIGSVGAFDEGGVLTPAPVYVDPTSGWLIYHTALNASRAPVIALHTAPADLSTATRVATTILAAGTGFEAGGCADPYVVASGTAMTMFYAGLDGTGAWSIGKAVGNTGTPLTFSARTQILAPGPAAYDSGGLRRPVAWQNPGDSVWHLWYAAIGSDGVERIAHASSADGTTWTKDGLVLIPSVVPHDFAEQGAWPAAALFDSGSSTLYLTFTGIDRYGWRRTGLLAAVGPGHVEGATATYQTPGDATLAGPSYLPRDWRQILWNPPSVPEGSDLEVWVSYYPTYSGLWSNFFRIDNGADLPFLLTVKGMRWQVRATGNATDPAVTPQLDDLSVDNAAISFPATATATTISIGPSVGWYLLGWGDLTVKSDIPGGGSLNVAVADQEGTIILPSQPVGNGEWTTSLAGIPGTSGRLQLIFTMTPDAGTTPPGSPLLKSVNVLFSSTDVPSSLTLTATPNPLPYGQTATVSGWLMSDALPLAGQTVQLKRRLVTESVYTNIDPPVVTGIDGSFSVSGLVQDAGTVYRAEWVGGDVGGTIYPPAAGSITLAMMPSTMTFKAAVNPILYGKTTTLSGTLVSGATPLVGKSVLIRYRLSTSLTYTDLGTVITGAGGAFSWPTAVAPKKNTVYRAEFGTEAAAEFTLGVKPVVGLNVTGFLSRYRTWFRFPLGTTVTSKGTVVPNHRILGNGTSLGRVTIVIQINVAGKWRAIKRVVKTLTTKSAYSYPWKPGKKAKFRIQTLFPADTDHAAGKSVYRNVQVY